MLLHKFSKCIYAVCRRSAQNMCTMDLPHAILLSLFFTTLTNLYYTCFIFTGEDMRMHQCVAAYISDYFLALTATLPFRNIGIGQLASLDHSMWFHSPFRTDQWMLYDCESPRTGMLTTLGLLCFVLVPCLNDTTHHQQLVH